MMFDNMKPQLEESPKARNRKYFGMTTAQIGILAGLAVAACLLFAVGGVLFLQRGLNGPAAAPQDTPTPVFTATPFILPSVVPTQTITPVPYEMLIPLGWLQFKTALIEIWLPKEFKAPKSKTVDNSVNWAVPEMIATAPGTTSKSKVYNMFVVVSYEPMSGDSLDTYLNGKIATLSSSTRIADKRTITLNSQNVVRFVLEKRTDTVEVNDMVYVFLDGTTVWYVEYIAQINEYFTMVGTFENSAMTFRIVR